jgi:hypothetical protein
VNHDAAATFAEQWAKDWNHHDVEAVLSHFADDAVFTSPLAGQLFPESGGVIRGKDALRLYWSEGVRRNPASTRWSSASVPSRAPTAARCSPSAPGSSGPGTARIRRATGKGMTQAVPR